MISAKLLKDVVTEARPILERMLDDTRRLNGMFMEAWYSGHLDEIWSKYQKDNPGTWLTYYIRARGIGDIKIGKSNHVMTRVKSIYSGASRGADLVACYPAPITHELELHREFQHLRLCGEWFSPGDELLTHLELIGCDIGSFTDVVPAHFCRRFPHRLARAAREPRATEASPQ